MTNPTHPDTRTDRELLEMAAKAAGYEFVRHSECGSGVLLAGVQDAWRPLVDDGDCARLEALCGIDVKWWHDAVEAICRRDWPCQTYAFERFSACSGDRNAARRRASIRAAAALGDQQ
jgi:hypothetical protein